MTQGAKPTEKELLLLLKQKEVTAISYLYDEYAPLLYGVVWKEVKSEQLASDILKSTFLSILNECENIDCLQKSLFTWLLALLKKTASSNFKVSLNFRSLFVPEKTSVQRYFSAKNYQTNYAMAASFSVG